MYIYYVLRGNQGDKQIEVEGDIDEEHFPGIDLEDAPALITFLVRRAREESGPNTWIEWTECDLSDSLFDEEDHYIFFNGRWMRRSDAPWRKDRYN
ncbi:MAG: hypothetical protein J2P37_15540 [Ktedonobacteraceae bacterium]|nr:hypothetical protein [Ktedonobacteraceae bacterium]MBO0792111.1 hypothetical protein [Ktedonobacteraceae bacterium]